MIFYSVTWRIENFSMCLHEKSESFTSPSFTLPEVKNTNFYFRLYPRGCSKDGEENYISCFLERQDQNNRSKVTSFIVLFTLINSDYKLSVKSNSAALKLGINESRGSSRLISHDDLYKDAEKFLPNDVLTFQLRICPIFDGQITDAAPTELEEIFLSNSSHLNFTVEECFSKDSEIRSASLTHCSFVTHIPVERRILIWSIKSLNELREFEEVASVMLESKLHDGIKFLLDCWVDHESLIIDISRTGADLRKSFVKCKASFFDVSGDVQESEHLFDETYKHWSFTLIEKLNFSEESINNDSLKMKLEFLISYEPQQVVYLPLSVSSRQKDLTTEIQDILKKEECIDVFFECKNKKKFSAHKLLICAKSSLFRTMFAHEETKVVRMHDIDTTTVEHLRDYLYSDKLPDLKTEEILKLLYAADKYLIKNLKDDCVAFLKNNISEENMGDVLTVAYNHRNTDLKEYIIDFMLDGMDIECDEWKEFAEENPEVADDTMNAYYAKWRQVRNMK